MSVLFLVAAAIVSSRCVDGSQPSRVQVSLPDPSRHGRLVNASVCLPQDSNRKVPLLIFSHGWRVAAEDYDYICGQLASASDQPWAVALIETPLEDPSVQPPLLTPLAADAAFLSRELASHLPSAHLTGEVVLGGHSMGGGTSTLAMAPPLSAKADALALWAPGLYGDHPVDASPVTVPALVMLGTADCVNVGSMPLRGLDVFTKLSSKRKAIVVLKGANHCFWSKPVKGDCAYDICDAVPRLNQQLVGLKIFSRFAQAALGGAEDDWSAFESFLSMEQDEETGVTWDYQSSVSSPYGGLGPFCPAKCCSAALAKMGLCNNHSLVV